jgi:hypothetical protein
MGVAQAPLCTTQPCMTPGSATICQQARCRVRLSGPKVADAVIEALLLPQRFKEVFISSRLLLQLTDAVFQL